MNQIDPGTDPALTPAPDIEPTTEHCRDQITNSRAQTYKTCARKHEIAYEMQIRPLRTSDPINKGSAYHLALETYDLAKGNSEHKKQQGMCAIALYYSDVPSWCDDTHAWECQAQLVAIMFGLHCDYWQNDKLEILATEQNFEIPLINPASGRRSRTFVNAGKIDRIVKLPEDPSRVAVMEYKTTIQEIGPEADYWKRLRIDSQISGYILGARAKGYPAETVLYDVTRWPQLRPKKATPMETRKYTKDGRLYATQRDTDETPHEYGRRIYEAVCAEPDRYFRREEIVRLESDIREHQYDVWGTQAGIRDCQKSGIWPRNTGACLTHYGRCDYFDICTSGQYEALKQGVIPQGYRRAETMHEELQQDT